MNETIIEYCTLVHEIALLKQKLDSGVSMPYGNSLAWPQPMGIAERTNLELVLGAKVERFNDVLKDLKA